MTQGGGVAGRFACGEGRIEGPRPLRPIRICSLPWRATASGEPAAASLASAVRVTTLAPRGAVTVCAHHGTIRTVTHGRPDHRTVGRALDPPHPLVILDGVVHVASPRRLSSAGSRRAWRHPDPRRHHRAPQRAHGGHRMLSNTWGRRPLLVVFALVRWGCDGGRASRATDRNGFLHRVSQVRKFAGGRVSPRGGGATTCPRWLLAVLTGDVGRGRVTTGSE